MADGDTPLGIIRRHLALLSGKRILDCGCGVGLLARSLAADGAIVTGIDPSETVIETARSNVPDATFQVASAERLPFADGSFDAAIFMNALHHVPVQEMPGALAQTRRVVVGGGRVIVIEPLAEGTFDAVLRIIDDETLVRDRAQAAVAASLATGVFTLVESVPFTRHDFFDDVEAFVSRAKTVDPLRGFAVSRHRAALEAAFARHVVRDGRRWRLDQPHKADVLAVS